MSLHPSGKITLENVYEMVFPLDCCLFENVHELQSFHEWLQYMSTAWKPVAAH